MEKQENKSALVVNWRSLKVNKEKKKRWREWKKNLDDLGRRREVADLGLLQHLFDLLFQIS